MQDEVEIPKSRLARNSGTVPYCSETPLSETGQVIHVAVKDEQTGGPSVILVGRTRWPTPGSTGEQHSPDRAEGGALGRTTRPVMRFPPTWAAGPASDAPFATGTFSSPAWNRGLADDLAVPLRFREGIQEPWSSLGQAAWSTVLPRAKPGPCLSRTP